jgi:5-methylcytosine-specific restriction endonuclease McrA
MSACLCGRPALPGQASCQKHLRKRQTKKVPGSYGRTYRENRSLLLSQWSADLSTRCMRCGQRARVADPWEPGHIIDVAQGGTDQISNLRPEHRSCNRKAGAELAARRRKEAADKRAAERIQATVTYLEERRKVMA